MATEEKIISVHDNHFENNPVQMPMSVLFATPNLNRLQENSESTVSNITGLDLESAIFNVLNTPQLQIKISS